MNTTEIKIIDWVEVEEAKLLKVIPVVVKQYGNEGLTVCNAVKTALASPEEAIIVAALKQMIPGAGVWLPAVIAAISKAVGVAIPLITNVLADDNAPIEDQALAFVKYLQTLSPKMKNAGLLKLLSGIFQALDPTLSEVEADGAAQIAYTASVMKKAA